MRCSRANRIRSFGLKSLSLGTGLLGTAWAASAGDALVLVPVNREAQPPKKDEDSKQVPTLPETVVPGERTPATESTEPSTSAPGPLSQDPFGSTGAFGNRVDGPFLPDVQGTRINAGKKTVKVDLDERPPIIDTNYRQALLKTPGLLLSEESTPLVAIGYRGLNPDRNSFMQVMEDGIPIAASIFGFNESYYLPPFQVLDHIEFIHGGSALMYGPQPGGALNFVTKMPVTDRPFQFTAENAYGSHQLFSTYESASGTIGSLGYYVYGLHRDSNGFRDFNSAYELNYGGGKFALDLSDCSRLIISANTYEEDHGEPGRLTRAAFEADPNQANRRFDYFELQRTFGSVTYQEVLDDASLFELKVWGTDLSRFSRRQRNGGFGTPPSGPISDFRLQEYKVFGIEPRLRHDYQLFCDDESTFTTGMLFYYNDGLRHDTHGPNQFGGQVGPTPRRVTDQDTSYFSFFAENRFKYGALSVTPAVRLENVRQNVAESVNVVKAAAGEQLGDHTDSDFVHLFGVGVVYELAPKVEIYSNISQSYRPKVFEENVSPDAGNTIAGDLNPGKSYQADLGFLANPVPYFTVDTSLFYLEFTDQIGAIGPVIQNVGDSYHHGWEFATEVDVVAMCDAVNGTCNVDEFGSLGVFFNSMVLHAEFFNGPARGNAPQYAPDYIIRSGLSYTWHDPCARACDPCSAGGDSSGRGSGDYRRRELLKVWLTNTFVGKHFGDDGNSDNFFTPSYKVWDLTAEVQVCQNVALFGGIYNILDERYFGRTVGSGIEPADGRNYFVGMRVVW